MGEMRKRVHLNIENTSEKRFFVWGGRAMSIIVLKVGKAGEIFQV